MQYEASNPAIRMLLMLTTGRVCEQCVNARPASGTVHHIQKQPSTNRQGASAVSQCSEPGSRSQLRGDTRESIAQSREGAGQMQREQPRPDSKAVWCYEWPLQVLLTSSQCVGMVTWLSMLQFDSMNGPTIPINKLTVCWYGYMVVKAAVYFELQVTHRYLSN